MAEFQWGTCTGPQHSMPTGHHAGLRVDLCAMPACLAGAQLSAIAMLLSCAPIYLAAGALIMACAGPTAVPAMLPCIGCKQCCASCCA
jgi:hypothetical protein